MNLKKILPFFLLTLILVFAFWLRLSAFWLPHWKGDQNHYVVLAMKLDKLGFENYNLRGVKLGNFVVSRVPPVELAFCKLVDPQETGDLIQILRMVGQPYYDQPFHHRAPLLPFFLMVSHRVFAGDADLYGVCNSNLGKRVKVLKPAIIFKTQFWAAVVPLFFNLAVIFMTFLLGARFFSARVGLWAAFLMATNPVSVVLAHLLLVEDTVTFFAALSVFLFLIFYPKKNLAGIFLAGACAGLTILAKQTGGLILGAVGIYTFLSRRQKGKWASGFFTVEFLLFASGALLVSGFWFVKVWQHFGSPFHQPASTLSALEDDLTGWIRAVSNRPPPFIFFSLGVLCLSPVFSTVFLTFRSFFRGVKDAARGTRAPDVTVFLWLWVSGFYLFLVEPWNILALVANQEHRFFYMAYPALALLAASGIDRIRAVSTPWVKPLWMADTAVWAMLALNAWWGVPKAMEIIYSNALLF